MISGCFPIFLDGDVAFFAKPLAKMGCLLVDPISTRELGLCLRRREEMPPNPSPGES